MSFIHLSQPSDSLSRDDIENMRRGRKGGHNGNDFNYKGKRGIFISHYYQAALDYQWAGEDEQLEKEDGTDDQYENSLTNF